MEFGPQNTMTFPSTAPDPSEMLRSENNCDAKDFELHTMTPVSKQEPDDDSFLSEIPLDFFE